MEQTQWEKKACGCIKSTLPRVGKIVIRCQQHHGMPSKKGNRILCYLNEDGIVRPETDRLKRAVARARAEREFVGEYVYFARLGDLVKIGISGNPLERVASFNAELIISIEGDRELEKALHREFAALRVRGEWFRAAEPLLSRIEELREE